MARLTLRNVADMIPTWNRSQSDLAFDLRRMSRQGPVQSEAESDLLFQLLTGLNPVPTLNQILNKFTDRLHAPGFYGRFAVFILKTYGPQAPPILRGEGGPVPDDDVLIVESDVIVVDDDETPSEKSGKRFYKAEQAVWGAQQALLIAQAELEAASAQHTRDLSDEAERDDQRAAKFQRR